MVQFLSVAGSCPQWLHHNGPSWGNFDFIWCVVSCVMITSLKCHIILRNFWGSFAKPRLMQFHTYAFIGYIQSRQQLSFKMFFGQVRLGWCCCSSVNPETLLLSHALPSRLVEVEWHRGGDQWCWRVGVVGVNGKSALSYLIERHIYCISGQNK